MPITSTLTRSNAAISRTLKMASGVSTMAQMVVVAGAPAASSAADTRVRYATSPTLGITTAAGATAAAAATSASPHGVSSPLQRMVSSLPPYRPDEAAAQAWPRAASLASGATASSRSKMMASHGMVWAFSSARALAAGM